jgi:Ca2+-binding RTX toxin-like protein
MATITGTSAADSLIAVSSNPGDFILGLGGNDTITGGPGLDTLAGNENNDLIRSKGLGDFFLGGQGEDTLIGESETADDVIYGNKGADLIIGSPLGSNAIYGGQDNDTIYSLGNDLVNGEFGNDFIYSNGISTVFGGGAGSVSGVFDGDDTLVAGAGNQVIVAGTGRDQIIFQSAIRRNVSGKDVVEGGYGGSDIVRNLSIGNQISLSGLVSGDTIEFVAANADPNNSGGVLINFLGSASGQTITVENLSLNQLIASSSNFIRINNIAVNAANLVPSPGSDFLRFTV